MGEENIPVGRSAHGVTYRTNPELCTLAVFLLAIEGKDGELQGEHSPQ